MTFRTRNKHAAKLTAELVYTSRKRYADGEVTQEQLARELQVSITTVRNFLHGVTWQDIPVVQLPEDLEADIVRSQHTLEALLQADAAEPTPRHERFDPFESILKRGGDDPLRRLPQQETRTDEAQRSTDSGGQRHTDDADRPGARSTDDSTVPAGSSDRGDQTPEST